MFPIEETLSVSPSVGSVLRLAIAANAIPIGPPTELVVASPVTAVLGSVVVELTEFKLTKQVVFDVVGQLACDICEVDTPLPSVLEPR